MPSEDSKPLKKEDENNKSSGTKKVTSSNTKVAKVKKEEPESESVKKEPNSVKKEASRPVKKEPKVKKEEYDDDDMPLAKRTTNSKVKEVKKKKIKEEEKKKREKKVYDLPGQKRDPPEEKDPLRIFYGSLYQQNPTSEMSQIWLMESGLLPKDAAMKIYEKKQKKGPPQKLTSLVKAVAAVKSSTKSVTVQKKGPTSLVPSVKKKTANSTSKQSTSKQSTKRKYKDLSSEDDCDSDSDSDEVILSVAKRRKLA